MSIERQAHRQLIRAAVWRGVTSTIALPCYFLRGLANLLEIVARWFDSISDAAFYFEQDAARKYRLLTGVDLGLAATGSLDRYGSSTPEALEIAQKDLADDSDGEFDG